MRQVNMKPIISIERAVDILLAFSSKKMAMTVEELSKLTNIPNSTVYRILCTLENKKMVQFDEKNLKYRPGLKLFELSSVLPYVLDVRQEAEDYLDQLHYETGQTVVMAVKDEDQMLYVYKKERDGEGLKYVSIVGQRRHFSYGVLGPVLLAFLPEETIETILNKPYPKNSPYPLTDKDSLKNYIKESKEEKIFVDHDTHATGVTGISAPIFNLNGGVEAAFGVIGPTVQIENQLETFKTLVKDTSKIISSKMGYQD